MTTFIYIYLALSIVLGVYIETSKSYESSIMGRLKASLSEAAVVFDDPSLSDFQPGESFTGIKKILWVVFELLFSPFVVLFIEGALALIRLSIWIVKKSVH